MQSPADTPAFVQAAPRLRIEEVSLADIETIRQLNRVIFQEERIINTFEREALLMLLAFMGDKPVGFKIGYQESRYTYYSAKGGVLKAYRRQGISRQLLHDMMGRVRQARYHVFAFDTFPNMHPGMTVLGLEEGFRVTRADYNPTYRDYRLRFEKRLQEDVNDG